MTATGMIGEEKCFPMLRNKGYIFFLYITIAQFQRLMNFPNAGIAQLWYAIDSTPARNKQFQLVIGTVLCFK
jgi:hypothetical protein